MEYFIFGLDFFFEGMMIQGPLLHSHLPSQVRGNHQLLQFSNRLPLSSLQSIGPWKNSFLHSCVGMSSSTSSRTFFKPRLWLRAHSLLLRDLSHLPVSFSAEASWRADWCAGRAVLAAVAASLQLIATLGRSLRPVPVYSNLHRTPRMFR